MEIFFIVVGAIVATVFAVAIVSKLANLSVLAAASAVALLVPLLVYGITTSVSKSDQETYYEFWNGSEIQAGTTVDTCERDGSCSNTYQCDPYQVVETEYYTDSEGEQQSRLVTKTKYHSCPYSTEETDYFVDTTLGAFTVASNVMTGKEWRFGNPIPGGQVTTPPALWTEADTRIKAGNHGGVTKQSAYKNFILAADETLFRSYSNTIDDLNAEGLLTLPASSVYDIYDAQKAYALGFDGKVNVVPFSEDMQYLNAAVGTMLRGDAHVVFVNADKAGDPTDYTNALHAYWSSEDAGKHAIPKNAVVIVVGVGAYEKPDVETTDTEPTTEPTAAPEGTVAPVEEVVEPTEPEIAEGAPVVSWARAFTGMPLGNEALMTQIQSELQGIVVDENFIGRPKFDPESQTYSMSGGAVESLLFGDNQFERVSMTALDEDDNGSGFQYLSDAWVPDEGTMALIFWISSIIAGLALAAGGVLGYMYNREFDPIKEYGSQFIGAMKKEK